MEYQYNNGNSNRPKDDTTVPSNPNIDDDADLQYNTNVSEYRYYGNPKTIKKSDYGRLKEITYARLGITVDRVKQELLGMKEDLIDPSTGKEYPDSFYEMYINSACAQVEKEFDITIRPRVKAERLDFNNTDFNSYMYTRTYLRPIIQVDDLRLSFNNTSNFKFPDQWIKVTARYGQIEVQPNFLMGVDSNFNTLGMPLFDSTNLSPMSAMYGYGNTQFAPQMVNATYIAGMLPQDPNNIGINEDIFIQPDLITYIAKYAAIEVLEKWGRLVIGAGIAGYSISIDGYSSSVDSTQSAENTASTADIKLIQDDMKDLRNALQSYYGYSMGVLS